MARRLDTRQRAIELQMSVLKSRYYFDPDSPSCLRMKIANGQHNRQKKFPGDVAGWQDSKGYWVVGIGRVFVKVSRIVWLLTNGPIPDGLFIDHKDGDPSNNNPENLQVITNAANARALNKIPCTSSSGFMGVSQRSENGMWRAYLTRNGKRRYFGQYHTAIEAAKQFNKEAILWAEQHGEQPRYLNPV